MKMQKYITLAFFFVCCLPLVVYAAQIHDDDLTYGFLDDPLPSEVMLYEGVINGISEEDDHIIINDTLYTFSSDPLLLTPGKSHTTLKYFTKGTSVKFYAHVQNKVIYEIMATSLPNNSDGKDKAPTKKAGDLIFENGVWHN